MGHSTIDIPTRFLMPAAKVAFIEWIASIPCTTHVKRHLLATWKRSTGIDLYAEDYMDALNTDTGGLHHAP